MPVPPISTGKLIERSAGTERSGGPGFSFNGVADGDYYITALAFSPNGNIAISEPVSQKP